MRPIIKSDVFENLTTRPTQQIDRMELEVLLCLCESGGSNFSPAASEVLPTTVEFDYEWDRITSARK